MKASNDIDSNRKPSGPPFPFSKGGRGQGMGVPEARQAEHQKPPLAKNEQGEGRVGVPERGNQRSLKALAISQTPPNFHSPNQGIEEPKTEEPTPSLRTSNGTSHSPNRGIEESRIEQSNPPSHLALSTSHSASPAPSTEYRAPRTATSVLTAYGEYLMPRLKRVRPRGYERPGERRTDHRFQAWLRVVTEPSYTEYEPDVKRYYTGEGVRTKAVTEFEAILTISLALTPFKVTDLKESAPTELKGALIPVSAAAIFAGVAVKTIHRWIEKGLKHQKKGAYYWISVQDLERFYESKQTARKRGTRPPLPLTTKE